MNELNCIQFGLIVFLLLIVGIWRRRAIEAEDVLRMLTDPRFTIIYTPSKEKE